MSLNLAGTGAMTARFKVPVFYTFGWLVVLLGVVLPGLIRSGIFDIEGLP